MSIPIYFDYLRGDNVAVVFVSLNKLHVGHCSVVRRICEIYFAERRMGEMILNVEPRVIEDKLFYGTRRSDTCIVMEKENRK